jgi:uncharacterized membrane protein YgcG
MVIKPLARWTAVILSGAVLLLAVPAASAKSYDLPAARVVITVQPDGSLVITEDITFAFSGSFSGAERKMPVRPFERLDEVAVSEQGRAYRPGASTATGSAGEPGTFGARREGDREHIVWHYAASDQTRTFRIGYRLRGAALAYDDIVEINQQVWGDEWPARLGRLEAVVILPGPADRSSLRAWGHPGSVAGTVELGSDRITLNARNIPSRQRVELHTTIPRALLTSTGGARTHPGQGMGTALAAERERAKDEGDAAPVAPTVLASLGLGTLLGLLLLLGLYLRYGRERPVPSPHGVVSTPPSDLPPAMVPSLLESTRAVGSRELTATILDLLRRGVFRTEEVAGPARSKGDGGPMADVRVGPAQGSRPRLRRFEADAALLLQEALRAGGPFKLSELPSRLLRNKQRSRVVRDRFIAHVTAAVADEGWYDRSGRRVLGRLRLVFYFGALVAFPLGSSIGGRRGGVGLLLGTVACVLMLLAGGTSARLTTRRTAQAAVAAEPWRAFKRHLERLEAAGDDAAPQRRGRWDELLVYGVALGVSDPVLKAAATLTGNRHRQLSPLYSGYREGLADGVTNPYITLSDTVWIKLGPPSAHRVSRGGSDGTGGAFDGGYSSGSDGGGSSGGGGGSAW